MGRFLPLLTLASVLLSSCAPVPRYAKPPPPGSSLVEKKWEPGARPYEVNGVRYYPLPDAQGFVEYGKASWYGTEFHGRPTASGRTYDMYAKTAAHKILPLDTMVRVVNLSNNKSIIVPVNDRGPFVKGRVIDLSYGAAKELDMIGPGVVDVRVEALAREVGLDRSQGTVVPVLEWQDFRKGEFTVQVGAFAVRSNAERLRKRLGDKWGPIFIQKYDSPHGLLYRVQVGEERTERAAQRLAGELRSRQGFRTTFVVRLDL